MASVQSTGLAANDDTIAGLVKGPSSQASEAGGAGVGDGTGERNGRLVGGGSGGVGPDDGAAASVVGVVDLVGGTMDGSARVAVEVDQGELGCGDEHYPIGAFQVAVGDTVMFELADGDPGARPNFWFPPGEETCANAPSVRARQFRVDCPAGTAAAAAALAAARSQWERVGQRSYEFAVTWHVFNDAFGDYRIAVADGEAVSIVRSNGTRLAPARVAGDLQRTIDELFDALAREVSADSFEASYDPELGYPTSGLVDEIRKAKTRNSRFAFPSSRPDR